MKIANFPYFKVKTIGFGCDFFPTFQDHCFFLRGAGQASLARILMVVSKSQSYPATFTNCMYRQ